MLPIGCHANQCCHGYLLLSIPGNVLGRRPVILLNRKDPIWTVEGRGEREGREREGREGGEGIDG